MSPPGARAAPVLGRCGLASLFVLGGLAKAFAPEPYLETMRGASLEPAGLLLALVAALELGGGLAIAFGLRVGLWAALALAAHTLATNVLVHRFWELEEPIRRLELSAFFKNVSIAGALLYYAAVRPVTGEEGRIAVRRGSPVAFLGYWRDPAATAAEFDGDWLVTGDRGVREPDGAFRFVGRDDDMITSSGYRIGPGEVEDCLIGHPAVALAGVVGKPDAARGEIVVAYVVLASGHAPSAALADEIARHVEVRLAAHDYPREVAFVDALPTTATGKIVRRELRARARGE